MFTLLQYKQYTKYRKNYFPQRISIYSTLSNGQYFTNNGKEKSFCRLKRLAV